LGSHWQNQETTTASAEKIATRAMSRAERFIGL
jgi:hypothetical protein